MASSTPGEDEFFVGISPKVGRFVKRLQRQASRQGRGEAFLVAFKTIVHRLQTDARLFGEELFHLPKLNLMIRFGVVRPVGVDYAVHNVEPVVFFRSIKLLGNFGQ